MVTTPTSTLTVAAAPAPAQTQASSRDPLPGEQVYDFSGGKATQAPNPTTPPPAPKTPSAAPVPTYSFLDGSKFASSGKQISPPTVVTAKPATQDLSNKQAALDQAVQAQSQQTQNIATQNSTEQSASPAPAAPAATADDLSKIINGEAANPANDAIKAVQDQADTAYQDFQSKVQQIQNGTFPLTPAQQAQVNATQASFDQLKNAQTLANQNYEAQVRIAGITSGRNMTAPLINTSIVKAAVDNGISKIANIDSQASKAVADLQQGFMDKDYQMINDAYSAASKLFADKTTAIQEMNDNVRNATNDALAIHKQQFDEQQALMKPLNDVMTLAAQNGADQATLDKIGSAKSVQDAISIAGYSLGAGFRQKVAQQEFDNKMAQAQLDISKASLAVSQGNLSISRERLALDKTKEAFDEAQKTAGTASPVMQQALAKASIDLVSGIAKDGALSSAVGPNAASRIQFNPFSGAKQNFIASVEQMRSQLNLNALIDAKAKGATFGALSDQELQVLASTATKIGTWAMKDKDGKVTGYNASEKDFKQELDKINNFAKLDYVLKGGSPADVNIKQEPDGTYTTINSDGSITNLGE